MTRSDSPSRGPSTPEGVDPGLWSRLVAAARERARGAEPAHDFSHVERVVATTLRIARAEGAEEGVPATAALLHELFSYPKGHPSSPFSGDVCAEHARALLEREGAPSALLDGAPLAIRDHAFSKGAVPDALASRILQDADRLDALGAIGLARMWATCAEMRRPFYAPEDPFCDARAPDDKLWGLDHVFKKLLVVPERLHTRTARGIATRRAELIRAYVEELRDELRGSG